jgi:hypothetical protein
MSDKPMKSALSLDIEAGDIGAILAKLFRRLLVRINVDANRYEQLIEAYIDKAKIPRNMKELSSVRGNIRNEIFSFSMSWKSFVKSLVFLRTHSFKIGLAFEDQNHNTHFVVEETVFNHAELNVQLFYGNEKDKSVLNTDETLHKLFHKIKAVVNDSGLSDNDLLTAYADKVSLGRTKSDYSAIRGGLKKDFGRGQMTWRVFINGLHYLNIMNFIVVVEIRTLRNEIYKVDFKVGLGDSE